MSVQHDAKSMKPQCEIHTILEHEKSLTRIHDDRSVLVVSMFLIAGQRHGNGMN
jgi:hypothetical protein